MSSNLEGTSVRGRESFDERDGATFSVLPLAQPFVFYPLCRWQLSKLFALLRRDVVAWLSALV
jgi:hypothetical protein